MKKRQYYSRKHFQHKTIAGKYSKWQAAAGFTGSEQKISDNVGLFSKTLLLLYIHIG